MLKIRALNKVQKGHILDPTKLDNFFPGWLNKWVKHYVQVVLIASPGAFCGVTTVIIY